MVKEVLTDQNGAAAAALADGDFTTAWYGDGTAGDLILRFDREYDLYSLEIFPADASEGFPNVKISASADGGSWTPLNCSEKGSNGTVFPLTKTAWLRLQSDSVKPGIREILFYGK